MQDNVLDWDDEEFGGGVMDVRVKSEGRRQTWSELELDVKGARW